MPKIISEFSCGGLVGDKGKVLIIRMKNMRGDKVWTFPKGHLEYPEKPHETAVREVEEETGYRCRIVKPLLKINYSFMRKGIKIDKSVQWYLMLSNAKMGTPDTAEIFDVRWVSFAKAKKMLIYDSDKKLLDLIECIQQDTNR